MVLSATAVAHAKPQATPCKLQDERGLYLTVVPDGSPRWRFGYRCEGKRRTMSLGIYRDAPSPTRAANLLGSDMWGAGTRLMQVGNPESRNALARASQIYRANEKMIAECEKQAPRRKKATANIGGTSAAILKSHCCTMRAQLPGERSGQSLQ